MDADCLYQWVQDIVTGHGSAAELRLTTDRNVPPAPIVAAAGSSVMAVVTTFGMLAAIGLAMLAVRKMRRG
ncbi:hypothetical protein [Bifidobacterium sp. AGR2158]|uniref:hypothetical protein n=1 Tax=Bifidobacterium sp. AGR2158 TaxID=1280675 RepID=UPI0003FD1232|nr:hypothetical protein [Bifidobacterium sp. AGR2158]